MSIQIIQSAERPIAGTFAVVSGVTVLCGQCAYGAAHSGKPVAFRGVAYRTSRSGGVKVGEADDISVDHSASCGYKALQKTCEPA